MSDLRVFHKLSEFIDYRNNLPPETKIGFVPTMGALHAGHGALIQRASRENDLTVLSIFVNPTQFNNSEDLKKYPRTWDADLELAKECGADVIISPDYNEIYTDQYRYVISENKFSKILCGAHRPGHFDGVLTIVMKLLQIVIPKRAYFGEKDYQQLKLIQDMNSAFFLRSQIVPHPTVREANGLAMSSRNVRLTSQGRELAPLIFKTLTEISNIAEAKDFLISKGIQVEYLEDHFERRFIAAFIDGVRLIDNVAITK